MPRNTQNYAQNQKKVDFTQMRVSKYKIYCLLMLFFVAGVTSALTFRYIGTFFWSHEDILPAGVIGDVHIEREGDMKYEGIGISKADYPVLLLSLDKAAGQLDQIFLLDGKERVLGKFYISDDRLSGIEILNRDDMPFFQMKYLKDRDKWGEASYCKRADNRKLKGEFYSDLNIDGQFDLLMKFNQLGDYMYSAVFFDNTWHPAVSVEDNFLSAKVVLDESKNETTDLLFDFEKGWSLETNKEHEN